jgi:hypothetical protein
VLAHATLANIISYADTILLTDSTIIEALGAGVPTLMDSLRQSHHRPQRFYAAAAVANASSHPRLASLITQNGGLSSHLAVTSYHSLMLIKGLQVCRELERQSLANLHVLGSKMGDCAKTAMFHLSEKREGDAKIGAMKYRYDHKPLLHLSKYKHYVVITYRFKWGTKPVMEISLANYRKHSSTLWCCFFAWLFIVFITFFPLIIV